MPLAPGEAERDVISALLILRFPMIYLSSITSTLKRIVEIHDPTSDVPCTYHQAYLEAC